LYLNEESFYKLGIAEISNLRPERWDVLSRDEKIATLQECENRISKLEGRLPATVQMVSFHLSPHEKVRQLDGGYNKERNLIGISSDFLGKGKVYEAFRVLIHESRHAYQYYAIRYPGFYKNQEEVREWKEGLSKQSLPALGNNKAIKRYNNNPFEQHPLLREELFTRILQREHEQQRSQERLKQELTERRSLDPPHRGKREKGSQTWDKEKVPPLRTFTFDESLTAEVREVRNNHLRHGVCKLTICEGEAQRHFEINIPEGFKARDLQLSKEEAKQLYQRGQTDSGKIWFSQTFQQSGQKRESSQQKTKSPSKDRSREQER
jgi:hypothetical protein